MNSAAYLAIMIIGVLSALAQYLLKIGLTDLAAGASTSGTAVALRFITNPRILLATAIYVAVFGIYLVLLAKMDVSQAFPTTIGANILFIAIMAITVLGEAATVPRLSGMAMIAAGIYLVAR